MGIDLDRGVKKAMDPETQIAVHMYKDNPGVYYDVHGMEIPEQFAKRAGFDVGEMRKKREHQKRIKEQMQRINEEFGRGAGRKIASKGGFSVVSVSDTHYNVYDDNSARIVNEVPLTEKDAARFLDTILRDSDQEQEKKR